MKKKICVVVASRANYGRIKSVMNAIEKHPDLELQLVVGASTLLERFGKAVDVIKKDGFSPNKSVYYVVEGDSLTTQAKSTGMGIIELTSAFDELKPDAVITVADRFETMATAIAVSYLNIPLIHVQGGEVSGNIDDRVRHAITKLADYHFVCSDLSRKRVVAMGEEEERVFNFGCPAMDILKEDNLKISNELLSGYGGVGSAIDWTKPYVLLVQHPVTTSFGDGYMQISASLEALKRIKDIQKIVLWPNVDAGTDQVSKGIRVFREKNMAENFHYFKNFSPEDYARVIANAACCVGNSSSFIREGSFLGVPAVIVGDRQRGREHGKNIVFSGYNADEIEAKVLTAIKVRRFERDHLFGNGNAGTKIADSLAQLDLNIHKKPLSDTLNII